MTPEDAQALTQEVQAQKEQIETLWQEQETFTHEAYGRAQILEKTVDDVRLTKPFSTMKF